MGLSEEAWLRICLDGLGGQKSRVLTFFTAGANGVHVPQGLHEGRIHLELTTCGRQVLGASKGQWSEMMGLTRVGIGDRRSEQDSRKQREWGKLEVTGQVNKSKLGNRGRATQSGESEHRARGPLGKPVMGDGAPLHTHPFTHPSGNLPGIARRRHSQG